MGINLGLRLLTIGLSFVLLLLIAYYFLVVNRSVVPRLPPQEVTLKSLEAEKRKADAALIGKIKSALAQTKRLHGYSIGVECKDGLVTLHGDVPTEIDKELAANLAQETTGVKEVKNQLRVAPQATPQAGEVVTQDLALNVDDLELQANLREQVLSVPELKAQNIRIKVQNRIVTLSGTVASEAQKTRAEQLLRNYPKVTAVNNQLRLGTPSAPPPSTTPSPPAATPPPPVKDQELTQMVMTVLTTNRADFSQLEAIKVAAQDGEITLSGLTPTRAERALAERLTKEVAGVRSVKNLLVIGAQ
jgi:osmotically-inducible protein OsmY